MSLMQLTMWTDEVDDLGVEQTLPTVVNTEAVRNFYPRKGRRVGTRITFVSGAGMAVQEPFHVVAARMGLPEVPEYTAPAIVNHAGEGEVNEIESTQH
jgi:hypothetical protein